MPVGDRRYGGALTMPARRLSAVVLGCTFVLSASLSSRPGAGEATAGLLLLGDPRAADLLNLDPEGLEARLGLPDFKRVDHPAEYWRYGDGRCALHLFLYQSPGGEGLRVTHARLRDGGEDGEEPAPCGLPEARSGGRPL